MKKSNLLLILVIILVQSISLISSAENSEFAESKEYDMIVRAEKIYTLWIRKINLSREKSALKPIMLTKTKRRASTFSPEQPYISGKNIILNKLNIYIENLPQPIRNVLFSNVKPDDKIPDGLTEDEFVSYRRKLKGIAEDAYIQKDVEENLNTYKDFRTRDIRSYLTLKKISNLEFKLKNFHLVENEIERSVILTALSGICMHSGAGKRNCSEKVNDSVINSSLFEVYKEFWYLAEYWSKAPFRISPSHKNSNIKVDRKKKQLIVPVLNPQSKLLRKVIKENVEDEFKGADWTTRVEFTSDEKSAAVKVQIQENVIPSHGNSTITLSSHEDLNDEYTKWTIRHEFGHVFGFNDCYLRFIDSDDEHLVYYEYDSQNLMCAMWGKFHPYMMDELIRTYVNN